ncbi:hypothetical protein N9W82_00550 [Candidatus Pelagibacter bacterium]|nr:hypothetical protein [Candidatus Pelagibacter bacterium]
MAKDSGKTTFIVFIMFMMCLSSIVAAGGLYVTSKEKVDGTTLEIRSEATNIAVLPRPANIVGRYNAASLKNDKWEDLSGKANHISADKIKGTLSKGEGFKGEFVKGTTSDGFTLPQVFDNKNWSFFAVARYGSNQNQQRIFVSGETDKNWFIGHISKFTGVAQYDKPITPSPLTNVHGTRSWIRITAQHNNFETNGKSRTTGFSFNTDDQKPFNNPKSIGINVGMYAEEQASDWNVYEILVYDVTLDVVDREKVDKYLKEKYILGSLKSGVEIAGGRPNTDTVKLSVDEDKSEPWYGGKQRFGTQEDCRRYALELGYPQWGHYNEKHEDEAKRNTCFFYGPEIVEIKAADQLKDDGETGVDDMTFGCTQPYRDPKLMCEAGSGSGSGGPVGGVAANASGAYCKAKEGVDTSSGIDRVQAEVCGKHCTKDKCMDPSETFTLGDGGASYKLDDYCVWSNTPDFETFYNTLIKDVATHPNAPIPNKDTDGNAIDYLGKHLTQCTDFKVPSVKNVKVIWFGFENKSEYLNISEIEVYSGGVNIVKDWDGSQVTEKNSADTDHGPKKLFDGVLDGSPMYHSGPGNNNYVKIDLDKEYDIEKVRVVNREHCGNATTDDNDTNNDKDGWCNNRWESAVLKLIGSDGTTVLKTGEAITSTDTAAGAKTYYFI